MTLYLPAPIKLEIEAHLQAAYPNEGAGLLLGRAAGTDKSVETIVAFENKFDAEEQHHRYLITAEDMLQGEITAAERDLDVVGIFHSHPDHPAIPSEYDREHALPWYAYLIVSVVHGDPADARAWQLADDRSHFDEESLNNTPDTGSTGR